MKRWLRALFEGRPTWMNALMVFCGFMAFVYVPWDFLIKPVAGDEEVWLGLRFTGWGAKLSEPFHWAIYAAGWYGFRNMKAWMWPWAAVYAGQVALGMLLWNFIYVGGFGGVVARPRFVRAVRGADVRALAGGRPVRRCARAAARALRRLGAGDGRVGGDRRGVRARVRARGPLGGADGAPRDRLRELAAELEKTYHVATRVVAADLADAAGPERVADAVADLEIAVLVNNAGFGASGRFEKLAGRAPARDGAAQLRGAGAARRSRLLPGMRARGRGAVVITGSVAGRQGLPLHGVYSATRPSTCCSANRSGRRARGPGHRRARARAGLDGDRVPAGGGRDAAPGRIGGGGGGGRARRARPTPHRGLGLVQLAARERRAAPRAAPPRHQRRRRADGRADAGAPPLTPPARKRKAAGRPARPQSGRAARRSRAKLQQNWLVKSDPETYGWDELVKDGGTRWDGVRNAEARNSLAAMRPGDLALFYHSGADKAVVGIAKVESAAYPEPGCRRSALARRRSRAARRSSRARSRSRRSRRERSLAKLKLVTHSRLSVMPIDAPAFERILALARSQPKR